MKFLRTLAAILLLGAALSACDTVPSDDPAAAPEAAQGQEGGGMDGPGGEGGGGEMGDGGAGIERPGGIGEWGLDGSFAEGSEGAVLTATGYRIHFAYDSAQLSDPALEAVAQNAAWLRGNAKNIVIEGHCDERGTREYNLALGQERADAVKRALVSQGVGEGRIQTVSYGKERPLVGGHDKESWAANRRGEVSFR